MHSAKCLTKKKYSSLSCFFKQQLQRLRNEANKINKLNGQLRLAIKSESDVVPHVRLVNSREEIGNFWRIFNLIYPSDQKKFKEKWFAVWTNAQRANVSSVGHFILFAA